MGGPYAGGPPTNGSSGYPQQRYDSPSRQPYDSRSNAPAMSSRNGPAGDYAPSQMDRNAYNPGRPDPSQTVQAPSRQQNPAGYQLADPPQSRALAPAPYGAGPLTNRPSEERKNSSMAVNGQRRPSGSRICGKCGEPLQGQFVRALDNTFHLDCFTCHVRGIQFVLVLWSFVLM